MPRVPRVQQPAKKAGQPSVSNPPKAHPLAYKPVARPNTSAIDPAVIAREHAAKVIRWRTPALVAGSIVAGTIAFYLGSIYVSTTRPSTFERDGPTSQSDLIKVYDRTASSFDTDVGLSEWLMGVQGIRRSLAMQCKGDVLEVSAGTGRNLGYYKIGAPGKGVESVTLVDLSGEMLEQAKKKWIALKAGGEVQGLQRVPVRFLKGDCAASMLPPPPLPLIPQEGTDGQRSSKQKVEVQEKAQALQVVARKEGYDTVIQTLGLCSTDSPVELLQNLSKHLDPSNPDATILLYEHGRSYYDWLNDILDKQAPKHADQHGCWWNRDIGEIVRKSGLEVVRERRKHLGTTWLYELKGSKESPRIEKEEGPSTTDDVKPEEPSSGSSSWLPRWTYEKICKS